MEFYLSDADRRRREKGEDPREAIGTAAEEAGDGGAKSTAAAAKKKTVSIASVLSEDEQYQKAAAQLASRAASDGQKEAGFINGGRVLGCVNHSKSIITQPTTHSSYFINP